MGEDKDKGTSEEVTLTSQELTVNLPKDGSGKLSTNGWVINAVGMLALPIIPELSTAILFPSVTEQACPSSSSYLLNRDAGNRSPSKAAPETARGGFLCEVQDKIHYGNGIEL